MQRSRSRRRSRSRQARADSPTRSASALLGRRRDDEGTVEVPGGRRSYVVVEIRYEAEGSGD